VRHPWLHWKTWLEVERIADLRPAGTLIFSGYEQIIPAAVTGHGVALGRSPLVKDLIASGELVAPFKSIADPARAYFAIVSKSARDVRSRRLRRLAEGGSVPALTGRGSAGRNRSRSLRSWSSPRSPLEREHQLADVLRALHQAVRLGRLIEREGLVDGGLDFPCLDERPDLLAQPAREVALELDGRGRSVEPVTVRRRRMSSLMSSSVFGPRRKAMKTAGRRRRGISARAARSRRRPCRG